MLQSQLPVLNQSECVHNLSSGTALVPYVDVDVRLVQRAAHTINRHYPLAVELARSQMTGMVMDGSETACVPAVGKAMQVGTGSEVNRLKHRGTTLTQMQLTATKIRRTRRLQTDTHYPVRQTVKVLLIVISWIDQY